MTTTPVKYRLDINTEDYQADFMVNGIPIVRNYSGNQIDTEIPVTQFILPGRNLLSSDIFVEPEAYGPVPRMSVKLQMQRTSEDGDWETVAELAKSGFFVSGEVVALPGTSMNATFGETTVTIDYETDIGTIERAVELFMEGPQWNWASAPIIPDTTDVKTSLAEVYLMIAGQLRALSEGRLESDDGLRGMFAEFCEETALATDGVTPDIAFGVLGFQAMAQDQEYRMMPLGDPQTWGIEWAAGGRLARLYPRQRDSILTFLQTHTGLAMSYDFWFRRNGRQWIPTR